MDHEFLTVEELAGKLRVPKSWVYSQSRIKGPDAMPRLKVGKYLRFRLDEFVAWIREKE